jgi:hypothetical protein
MIVEGYQIPKGWSVAFSISLTHQLDPTTRTDDGSHMDLKKGFCPMRWLDASTRPSEFLPFGAGPRACIGKALALAEIKVFLCELLRRFDRKFCLCVFHASLGGLQFSTQVAPGRDCEGSDSLQCRRACVRPEVDAKCTASGAVQLHRFGCHALKDFRLCREARNQRRC